MLGIFLLIAGTLSLLEVFGIIDTGVKWGGPLFIICIGLSIIFHDWRDKKDDKNTLDA